MFSPGPTPDFAVPTSTPGIIITTATPAPAAGETSYIIVDRVDWATDGATPAQVTLTITGTRPNGCDLPVTVWQYVADENSVLVDVFYEVPAGTVCTAALVPYETTIVLDEPISQTTTVYVNGATVTIPVF